MKLVKMKGMLRCVLIVCWRSKLITLKCFIFDWLFIKTVLTLAFHNSSSDPSNQTVWLVFFLCGRRVEEEDEEGKNFYWKRSDHDFVLHICITILVFSHSVRSCSSSKKNLEIWIWMWPKGMMTMMIKKFLFVSDFVGKINNRYLSESEHAWLVAVG